MSRFARVAACAAGIAVILAIVPFVALARFAHPSYDDWCIADQARSLGFWGAERFWYTHWAGRFVAIALWNLIPISRSSLESYKVLPLIFLGGMLIGLFWLSFEALRGKLANSQIVLFALSLFAVYLNAMPSPAEGFYWYDGVTVTTSGAIFALFAVAAALRSQRGQLRFVGWCWSLVASLFAVLAAGSNEIVLQLLGLILLVGLWLSRRYRAPRWPLWLPPLAFSTLAGVVDVLAPGNYKRASLSGGLTKFAGPLAGSVASWGAALLDWLSRGPIIIGLVLVTMAGSLSASRIPDDSPWRKTSWLLPVGVGLVGIWGILFFTHWASGFAFKPGPPDRVLNVALLFFLLVGIPAAFMVGVQLLGRYGAMVSEWMPGRPWSMFVLSAMLFGAGNVRQAWMDLLSHKAADYDRELRARHQIVRAASHAGQALVVPPLERVPKTIHFKDITNDPQHPHNACYARFWDVPSVRLSH